ncbi:hypothetical protein LCGC14_1788950 [marine sediment metagenome]|uniref:Uncharacterized protein n=1 Tax=marine sediment metagenome TaxID=412755 RepID=A0A0F9GT62_9ZZZZ
MKYQITVKCGPYLVNRMVVDSDQTNQAHLSGIGLIVHPEGVFTHDGLVKLSGRNRLSISATRYRAPKEVTG